MKTFDLLTSDDEKIASIVAHSQDEAVTHFCLVKKLSEEDLLKIFEALIRD